VHTSSAAGFAGNIGQANYSSAKIAVLGLSSVVNLEAARYGVRSNVVSPSARTRLALSAPGTDELVKPPEDEKDFDRFDPANVSPLIGWLAEANCQAAAQIFHLIGNKLMVMAMPGIIHELETEGRWTLEALDRELSSKLVPPVDVARFIT
jgi:NAD(P)-dependent dehydrogenase (short-subunit alcohol dehydrogenase family)